MKPNGKSSNGQRTIATNPVVDTSQALQDDALIADAMGRAVHAALWRHKRLGESIVAWRDGKVVTIPAEEIPVDEHGFTNERST